MNPIVYILSTNGLLFLLSIIFWKFPPKKLIIYMVTEHLELCEV